jgi:hypothetical protein
MPARAVRDYVYISGRKVERMAPTLRRRPWWTRLKGFNLTAGPVGAGVNLAERPQDGVVEGVAGIEEAIRSEHRVRPVTSTDVRVGHWIDASALPMAYGIPVGFGRLAGSAAVFAGVTGSTYVVLSGSAEHLLDRHVEPTDMSGSMSAPQTIDALLAAARREPEHTGTRVARSRWIDVGYPVHNLLEELSRAGLHPLTFLARVTHVSLSAQKQVHDEERYIVGTPLYVSLEVPD